MHWPVMKDASDDSRNATREAISSGSPMRPSGWTTSFSRAAAAGSGAAAIASRLRGVRMPDGSTALQRMPAGAYSTAACIVRELIAPLHAAYAAHPGNDARACVEEM